MKVSKTSRKHEQIAKTCFQDGGSSFFANQVAPRIKTNGKKIEDQAVIPEHPKQIVKAKFKNRNLNAGVIS